MKIARITRPLFAARIGVPTGAGMSTPACSRPQRMPNGEDTVPLIGQMSPPEPGRIGPVDCKVHRSVSSRDDLSTDVATRIAEVVEAELRNQVAESRRRLDAEVDDRLRRLREMTNALLERAASVSNELDGLAAALRRAAVDAADSADAPLGGELNGGGERTLEAAPTVVSPAPPSVADLEAELSGPPAATTVAADPPAPPAPAALSDAARLVAVEMALAGSSRDDVDRHLRSTYNVGETTDLLDDVFGR